jgi:hypothetical protein
VVDLGGRPNLAVHRRVDPIGWTVFAAVPHAEAFRQVDAIRGTVLAIAIPLGLVVAGGILLLLRLQRRQWRVEAALAVARSTPSSGSPSCCSSTTSPRSSPRASTTSSAAAGTCSG